jgi:hypothetical protein
MPNYYLSTEVLTMAIFAEDTEVPAAASADVPRGSNRMTTPRNRALFEQGQEIRAEILTLLACHLGTAMPLEAKHIRPLLIRRLAIRTIQCHVESIRAQNR